MDVCNSYTTVSYGRLIGNVSADSDLYCQRDPGHDGRHKVARWFGHVFMTAEWD